MLLQIKLLLVDIYYPKKIFSKLKNLKPSKGGEIHITDAIQSFNQ